MVMWVGPDTNGNLIEVGIQFESHPTDALVIHAMKARVEFLPQAPKRRRA